MFHDQHTALPTATHEEFARQQFCVSPRRLFITELWPGSRKAYNEQRLPKFVAENGRGQETLAECKRPMSESCYDRGRNAVRR